VCLLRILQFTGSAKCGGRCSVKGSALPAVLPVRLMRDIGLAGVIRGKPVRTTFSDKTASCPMDHVNRQFHAPAPNKLWMSDFTYVSTWAGFVYVAFVIDVYARYIVGWRVSRTAHASFVLDALGCVDSYCSHSMMAARVTTAR
jgi:putative transposase